MGTLVHSVSLVSPLEDLIHKGTFPCPSVCLSLSLSFCLSLYHCLVLNGNDIYEVYNPLNAPTPQKTMSRYTWECKTKEEPDCEVRLTTPQLRPKDSSSPFIVLFSCQSNCTDQSWPFLSSSSSSSS